MNYDKITKLDIESVNFNDIEHYENGYFYVSVDNELKYIYIKNPIVNELLFKKLKCQDSNIQKHCWFIPKGLKYIIVDYKVYPQKDKIKTIAEIIFDTFFPTKQELFTIEFMKQVFHYGGNYDLCYDNILINDYHQFKDIILYISYSYPTADIVEFDFDDDKWITFYNLMKIN